MDTEPERRNNYSPLRLAMALSVVLSHSYQLTHGTVENDPLYRLTRGQFTLGVFAVNGFFLLSGCLVTQSWLRHGTSLDFARRRVARLYPGYAVAFAFSAAAAAVTCGDPGGYLGHLARAGVAVLVPDGAALDWVGAYASNPVPG